MTTFIAPSSIMLSVFSLMVGGGKMDVGERRTKARTKTKGEQG